jgi:hypothetical protein
MTALGIISMIVGFICLDRFFERKSKAENIVDFGALCTGAFLLGYGFVTTVLYLTVGGST